MTRFTISPDAPAHKRVKKTAGALGAAAFWLAVWQIVSRIVAQEILLVSPVQACLRLFSLAGQPLFWRAVAATCLRVVGGMGAALVLGALMAALCARLRILKVLLQPLLGVVRATPVASIIVLSLVWMATDAIPAFIAFLMAFPMVWSNVSAGIDSADGELLEMAAVFRLRRGQILRYIYIPAVLPYFASACSSGLGFAWKSAVAAEVIALPRASVGRQIHNAKIYMETADLFAWTVAGILLSLLIERVAMWLLRTLSSRLGGAGKGESDAANR